MAKITTKLQKVFGATGATGNLGQFGSLKVGSPLYTDDVETIQALNEYGDGIANVLINGAPPAIQDINGLFYMITKQIAYLMQQGIPEWNADTTYYVGSFVTRPDGDDGEIFISVADDNLNNALSDTDYWMLYDSKKITKITGTVSEYNVAYDDSIIIFNLEGNCSVYLPEATSLNKGRIVFMANYGTAVSPAYSYITIGALGDPYTLIDGFQYLYLISSIGSFVPVPVSGAKFISNGSTWDSFDCYLASNVNT